MKDLINSNKISIDYDFSGTSDYLIVNVPNSRDIVNYQVQMLANNPMMHFLNIKRIQVNDKVCLYYNITNKVTLSQLLKNTKLKKDQFLNVIRSIASALLEAQEYQLEGKGIIFDKKYIYMESITSRPYFIYAPFYKDTVGLYNVGEFINQLKDEQSLDTESLLYVEPVLDTCFRKDVTPDILIALINKLFIKAPIQHVKKFINGSDDVLKKNIHSSEFKNINLDDLDTNKNYTSNQAEDINDGISDFFDDTTNDETQINNFEDPQDDNPVFFTRNMFVDVYDDYQSQDQTEYYKEFENLKKKDEDTVNLKPDVDTSKEIEDMLKNIELGNYKDFNEKSETLFKESSQNVLNETISEKKISEEKISEDFSERNMFDDFFDDPSSPDKESIDVLLERLKNYDKQNVQKYGINSGTDDDPTSSQIDEEVKHSPQIKSKIMHDIENREKIIKPSIKSSIKSSVKSSIKPDLSNNNFIDDDEDDVSTKIEITHTKQKNYFSNNKNLLIFSASQIIVVITIVFLASNSVFVNSEGSLQFFNILITVALIGVLEYILFIKLFDNSGVASVSRSSVALPGKDISIRTKSDPKTSETLVNKSFDDTVYIGASKKTPYLMCEVDGVNQKISITKDNFILGRFVGKVDYVCKSNKIGKMHAEIISRDGIYFIKDLNSKNGTYINSYRQRIISNIDYPIDNNDMILLADMEFHFCTE